MSVCWTVGRSVGCWSLFGWWVVGLLVGRQERASEHISINIHCAQQNLSCKLVFMERGDSAASDLFVSFCVVFFWFFVLQRVKRKRKKRKK